MKIEAITVCVHYTDLLKLTLKGWLKEVDRLVVVTSSRDPETIEFCKKIKNEKLVCHITDVFYEKGAHFNKGAAIEEALNHLDLDDWVLFWDSDIYLTNSNFREIVENQAKPGSLFGAPRFQVDDINAFRKGILPPLQRIGDIEFAGYFQLFHCSDPHVCDLHGKVRRPLLSTHWKHAGNYDSDFQNLWNPPEKNRLPLTLLHLGSFNQNWYGIQDPQHAAKMAAMYEERQRHQNLQNEKI